MWQTYFAMAVMVMAIIVMLISLTKSIEDREALDERLFYLEQKLGDEYRCRAEADAAILTEIAAIKKQTEEKSRVRPNKPIQKKPRRIDPSSGGSIK